MVDGKVRGPQARASLTKSGLDRFFSILSMIFEQCRIRLRLREESKANRRERVHTLDGILSRSGRLIGHQGLFVCLTRRDALQILYGCIRKLYPSAHSRNQACGEKDVRPRKGLAKDERAAGC